jgi:hypothetical protein
MTVANKLPRLLASARPGLDGVPLLAAASVPRLAPLAHAPTAPTVPAGLTITQMPPAIIAAINSASPMVCATRRLTRP